MELYCESLVRYQRWETQEVSIGELKLGNEQPIRVQSMTTTDTMDTQGSVDQSVRMIESGCELVRITAPSMKEAKNLGVIREELKLKGYDVPLVADIHFTPNAANVAAQLIQKVRINPGNFADKKKFEELEYTEDSYADELIRIREKFLPLLAICKQHKTALRIGTNHGSLSDRITSRYGDTALGMVESALEFLTICKENDFLDVVISMKSSNPQVMVQAYRMLVVRMKELDMNFPLHLGVTEAGDGADGRIKSAVGIGTLLEDGLGDTIRVSLTEDPEFEAPVAQMLIKRYANRVEHKAIPEVGTLTYNPYAYERRLTVEAAHIGGKNVPVVFASLTNRKEIKPAQLFAVGYQYAEDLDKWNLNDQACDFVFIGAADYQFELPGTLGFVRDAAVWASHANRVRTYPYFNWTEFQSAEKKHDQLNFVQVDLQTILSATNFSQLKNVVLVLETSNAHGMAEQRRAFIALQEKEIDLPVILKREYQEENEDEFMLFSATDTGALFLDGFGDGIWLTAQKVDNAVINSTSFGVLQATRTRISKTDYISCPSCGRTLFDLQETTAKIRKETNHLKGLKIGIMGCIVNGPGEMADADYGYVGTGPGKITLYKEKEVVKKNVPEDEAVQELVNLIRSHGDWVEPVMG